MMQAGSGQAKVLRRARHAVSRLCPCCMALQVGIDGVVLELRRGHLLVAVEARQGEAVERLLAAGGLTRDASRGLEIERG